MHKMKKYGLLLFGVCLVLVSVQAQSAQDQLKKVIDAQKGLQSYHLKMNYSFYGDGQSTPLQTMHGASQLLGNRRYFKFGDIEQFINEKLVITVNHEDKYVVLDKDDRYDQYRVSMDVKSVLSDLETQGKSLTLETISAQTGLIKVFNKETKAQDYALLFDKMTNRVLTVTTYYDEEETQELYGDDYKSSRLEMSIEYLPPAEPSDLIAAVLSKSGKDYKLKMAYKKYAFYDMSSK